MAQFAAPDGLVESLARDDRPLAPGHGGEQFELAHGQGQGLAGGQHEALVGANLELTRVEDVGHISTLLEDRHDAERPSPASVRSCKLVIYR